MTYLFPQSFDKILFLSLCGSAVCTFVFSFLQVQILTGIDKGKQGIVEKIVKENNWVFVEGLNIVSYISWL